MRDTYVIASTGDTLTVRDCMVVSSTKRNGGCMVRFVFWVDVDNTLLNNDEVKKVLDEHLDASLGHKLSDRFWMIYEQVRAEQDVVDIPLALERLRKQTSLAEMDEVTYEHVLSMFENYPFHQALYPRAIEVLRYLMTLGTAVIISDGDPYFQARKIVNSTIAETVEGRVLLFKHKQEHLQDIVQAYGAEHYVLVDDKPKIIVDMAHLLGKRVTTVFVKQGKYAHGGFEEDFTPDITVDHIGDLLNYTVADFDQK